jgi:Cytochrome b(C-terminal)/b6/petD
MHDPHTLTSALQTGLGFFYLLVAAMNVGFAAYFYYTVKSVAQAAIWIAVAGLFLLHSVAYFAHLGWIIPEAVQEGVNSAMNPITYFVGACGGLFLVLYFRRFFTDPIVAWTILMLGLLFSGWAMTNDNFKAIITKPDNVPIVMLIFSVGFLTWLALRKGVINDDRLARGEPPMEKAFGADEKVLVWPDLVYTELIAMVVCTLILVVWAVVLKAPLEQPASPSRIPNPSKAPWYFLGLQEMLVYFDPWMAGVVLPSMIINGLVALPYIDFNTKGNGYYTFAQRKFAVSTFLFGFVVLWVVLIVLGTFLRGPNWNFFGPFEPWDPHKTVPLNNVMFSDYFWLYMLGMSTDIPWYIRELPGIVLVLAYLLLLPPLLAKTILRPFFIRMGFVRFFVLVTLIQFMAALPIKMVLRWSPLNLKYIVFIPEWFFNI